MDGLENPKDTRGQKKPQIHLIPPVANAYEAVVMELGARRYGSFNWRQYPIKASVYYSAAMRHWMQFWDGEDVDQESGVSHVAHARACSGILLDAFAVGNIIDDRPLPGKTAEVLRELTEIKARQLELEAELEVSSPKDRRPLYGFCTDLSGKTNGCVVTD